MEEGSFSLPLDLVEEEILHRTPIESLVRFKTTCQEWYALFNSKRFIYKHLHLSQKRSIRIFRDTFQIINPVTLDLLSLPLPAEFPHGSIFIIHCDGLLLCSIVYEKHGFGYEHHGLLAVWNPVLSSRVKLIEPMGAYRPYYDVFGFGYDNDNKYKILRFEAIRGTGYEMYDLNSNLWTYFPATFEWFPITPIQNVSMKGNMYWIAQTKKTLETFIQSFDFSTETFKPICSPIPVRVRVTSVSPTDLSVVIYANPDIVVLSDFGGDRLSLLHQPKREIKIEVWVTNKVTDGVVSWTKYFNVTHPHLPVILHRECSFGNPSYFIHKTNGIMLWCDKVLQKGDKLVRGSFYEICEGEIKKQVETGPPFRSHGLNNPCICGSIYVPSLVPVPE
ncbi:unnamed protein product [Microthlaspi erraticum]|uniref:F-box associated beta-propeller type 1 domain-containing protein n=1 Tax=Microthlaspi erraticum TaxID=1685480 RepID=A0A6D2HC38_9BRAS|nr:unnamed protein product [Microthlaspi erraticum]